MNTYFFYRSGGGNALLGDTPPTPPDGASGAHYAVLIGKLAAVHARSLEEAKQKLDDSTLYTRVPKAWALRHCGSEGGRTLFKGLVSISQQQANQANAINPFTSAIDRSKFVGGGMAR